MARSIAFTPEHLSQHLSETRGMRENAKKKFIYDTVGRKPREGEISTGLTVSEVYSDLEDTTHRVLFPNADDRQLRLTRLSFEIMVQATVEQVLGHPLPDQTLGEQLHELKENELLLLPEHEHWKEIEKKLRPLETAEARTNWLAAHGYLLDCRFIPKLLAGHKQPDGQPLEVIPRTFPEMEAKYMADIKEFRKGTAPKPEHPCKFFAKQNRLISRYYTLIIPDVKDRARALEKRLAQGSDPLLSGAVHSHEANSHHVGRLTDVNRLSILPRTPQLGDLFFKRLNFYQREDAVGTEDREDFFRSPLKMNDCGLQDQKNYLRQTKHVVRKDAEGWDVYEEIDRRNRDFSGTVSEIANLCPQMYEAKQATDPIYEVQRAFEGDDHKFHAVKEEQLRPLRKDYETIRKEFMADEGLQERLGSPLSVPKDPLREYYELQSNIYSDETEVTNAFERGQAEIFNALRTIQRAMHIVKMKDASKLWRQRYIKDALRYNAGLTPTKEDGALSVARPIEDEFLQMVARDDINLKEMKVQASAELKAEFLLAHKHGYAKG